MTALSPQRYHALDALRGAMMLLGIYLHAACAYSPGGNWPWKQPELTPVLDPSMALIHVFRMPLFYAVAGFFAALLVARRGWTAVVRNRAQRILLPFALGWAVIFPLVVLFAGTGRLGLAATLDLFATGQFLAYAHPLHLWFLEYLLLLYLLAAAVVPLLVWLPEAWRGRGNHVFRAVVSSWWAPALLAVPSFLVLLAMPRAELQDPPGFLPLPRIVLAYAVPFAFGWLLHTNADLLEVLRRRGWAYLALALIPCAFYVALIPQTVDPGIRFYLRRAEHSLALWLLVFGVTGVFLRTLDQHSPRLRYLCDSSYFLYLGHMPVLLAFQLLLWPVPLPPLVKVMLALAGTTAVLLVFYEYLVRPGAVGWLLNGRRVARGGPQPSPV